MKTTMMFRPIANPRRTTLAHLADDGTAVFPGTAESPADEVTQADQLPASTANPRRTTLTEAPTS